MLKRARLYNVCQHADRTINLGPGLTIVVGPQGSGKTNLLSLSLASLLGSNPLYGKKSANIREGAEKDKSFVTTEWEIGGNLIQVTRGYSTKVKSNIAVNGEILPDVRRENEITNKVIELTGLNADRLWDFSYVAQSDTDAILTTKPVERVRFLASLLGMEQTLSWQPKAAVAISKLDGEISQDYASLIKQRLVDRNVTASALYHGRRLLDKATAELSSAKLTRDKYTPLLEAHRSLTSEVYLLEDARSRLASRTSSLSQAKSQLAEFRAKLKSLVDSVKQLSVYEELCKSNEQIHSLEHRRKVIEDRLSSLGTRMAAAAVTQPACQDSDPAVIEAVQRKLYEVQREHSLILAGKPVCEKCGSSINLSEDRKEFLRVSVNTLAAELRDLKLRRATWEDYSRRLQFYNTQLPGWEADVFQSESELTELEFELATVPPYKEVPKWYEANRVSLVNERYKQSEAEKKVYALEANISNLEVDITDQRARVSELKASVDLLRKQVGNFDHNAVLAVDSRIDTLSQEKQAIELDLATLIEQSKSHRQHLRHLISSYRGQRKAVRAKDLLSELSTHVVSKALPRDMLFDRLSGLGDRMSELCAELQQPYRIAIDNTLEFIVEHANGRVESAQRLSGGQAACVATAFWLVRLMSAIGNNLPLLILDEPSANMDPNGVVGQFGEMLSKLNPVLVSKGLQVVVITHHRQLIGCGEYVCDLGE